MKNNQALHEALNEAIEAYASANPRSQARYEDSKRTMPGGVTREVLRYEPFPLTITRAEANKVYDVDGHAYVDFVNEYTASLYGHACKPIRDELTRALGRGILFAGLTEAEAEFSRLICARIRSIEKTRFCNSGTEANLLGCSLARTVTGRDKIMVFAGGYHGGLLSFAHDVSALNAPYPVVIGEYNDCSGAVSLFEEHGHDVAVVLVEPMLGPGGCVPATKEFLALLEERAEMCGALFMLDEIMTSRLAPGGLQEVHGLSPDMTTVGKYMGGGLAFGALGGRAAIMDYLDGEHGLEHHGTFNNNILTMTAGLAGLRDVYIPKALAEMNLRGDRLRSRLNEAFENHGIAGCVSGTGSMMCVHFVPGPIRTAADVAGTAPEKLDLLRFWMLSKGVYLLKLGMIVLSLDTTDEDCGVLADSFQEFLEKYHAVL